MPSEMLTLSNDIVCSIEVVNFLYMSTVYTSYSHIVKGQRWRLFKSIVVIT